MFGILNKDLKGNEDRTGWKIGIENGSPRLIQLRIPEDARRISGSGNFNKYRCDKAEVINIFKAKFDLGEKQSKEKDGLIKRIYYSISDINIDHSRTYSEAYSPLADRVGGEEVKYKVGETIEVDEFDTREVRCSSGIHFFFSQKELFEYFERTMCSVKRKKINTYKLPNLYKNLKKRRSNRIRSSNKTKPQRIFSRINNKSKYTNTING